MPNMLVKIQPGATFWYNLQKLPLIEGVRCIDLTDGTGERLRDVVWWASDVSVSEIGYQKVNMFHSGSVDRFTSLLSYLNLKLTNFDAKYSK